MTFNPSIDFINFLIHNYSSLLITQFRQQVSSTLRNRELAFRYTSIFSNGRKLQNQSRKRTATSNKKKEKSKKTHTKQDVNDISRLRQDISSVFVSLIVCFGFDKFSNVFLRLERIAFVVLPVAFKIPLVM